eukprot:448535-Amorphochlora_amoeboformis.AAC.1
MHVRLSGKEKGPRQKGERGRARTQDSERKKLSRAKERSRKRGKRGKRARCERDAAAKRDSERNIAAMGS